MKIALIGATGYVGSRLLAEALARGHHVTAIVRKTEELPTHVHLKGVQADATDAVALAKIVEGHDAVITSFNPGHDADGRGTSAIIEGVRRARVVRLLAVGGAGTLE